MMLKSSSMLLLCSMAVALLTGCSHSKSQAPTQIAESITAAPAATQPPAKDDRPVIVAFGDSLTAGYGTNAGESYPDYLQRDLNARGYRYHVVNEGISGNTSKDGVVRVPTVVALHPAVVIVAFGGNDGLRGIPIADTETNLNTILSTLQNAHIKIILGGITLPPNYGEAYISKFDDIYARLAKTYHVPLLPFMLQDVYGVSGDMQSDSTHATAIGNQQVAKNFLPLLLPLLHKS